MRTLAPGLVPQAVALALAVALVLAVAPARADEDAAALYKELEPFIIEVQPDFDPVPSLNRPAFVSVPDAGLALDDDETVFVVQGPGGAEIYPQRIMARHEVLNLPGDPRRCLTYCPLTGSAMGWYGRVGLFNTAFGTTGRMLNSNRILYDHSTNSLWPQLLAMAISGPLAGERVRTFPVLWTTWAAARDRWPQAEVLSQTTGFRFNYNKDPYGSYQLQGNYYDTGGAYYPLAHVNLDLSAKTRVLGLLDGPAAMAVVKDAVRQRLAVNIDFGVEPLVALYDPALDAVRVFRGKAGKNTLTFTAMDGQVFDDQTRSRWSPEGKAVEGRLHDMTLESAESVECMWFAWVAFHPHTLVCQ